MPNNADLEWENNYLNQAINKFNNMTLTQEEFYNTLVKLKALNRT